MLRHFGVFEITLALYVEQRLVQILFLVPRTFRRLTALSIFYLPLLRRCESMLHVSESASRNLAQKFMEP